MDKYGKKTFIQIQLVKLNIFKLTKLTLFFLVFKMENVKKLKILIIGIRHKTVLKNRDHSKKNRLEIHNIIMKRLKTILAIRLELRRNM